MDVVTSGPLPVASLVWQPRPGAWVLTVVCKATFILRPGECALSPQQEPLLTEDRHHGDDPAKSLRCPRDVVPVKPGADVILVGSVFAPERRPVRALDARLVVGDREIDKTIEALADRTLRPDGSLREGAPFTQAPILYERTGGGPGTRNPVGVPRDARDAEGGMRLPNLQRPGASLQNVFEPVGFGPIAPSWPDRRERLMGKELSFRDLGQKPLPEGVDMAFFNAAPREQQLRALAEKIRIELVNLHPEHAHLVTHVPAAPPRAVLEGRREGPAAVILRADGLWIDTDRALCTVTFRGMVPLQTADERGRIVISWDAPATPALEMPSVKPIPRKYEMTADMPAEARRGKPPTMPVAAVGNPPSAPPPASFVAPAPAPNPAPPAPVPLSYTAAAESAPVPQSVAPPSPSLPASPWMMGSRPLESEPVALRPAPEPAPAPQPAAAPARAEVEEALELLWFDPEAIPRFRRKAEWRPILDALEDTPPDPEFDDPAFAKDPMIIEDRREVFELLAGVPPTTAEGLDAALGRSLRPDGRFVPGLALFAAELEMPFDELAALKVTVSTVTPLMGQDDALKSAVQSAREFLAIPDLMSAPGVAEGLVKRIEDAFAQTKRALPVGYLDAQRERALLEQRQYQRRAVLGEKHLRGLLKLTPPDAAPPGKVGASTKPSVNAVVVPAYLPLAVTDLLPLTPRFRARMLAEIRLSADRNEAHPAALKVLALARAAPPPKG